MSKSIIFIKNIIDWTRKTNQQINSRESNIYALESTAIPISNVGLSKLLHLGYSRNYTVDLIFKKHRSVIKRSLVKSYTQRSCAKPDLNNSFKSQFNVHDDPFKPYNTVGVPKTNSQLLNLKDELAKVENRALLPGCIQLDYGIKAQAYKIHDQNSIAYQKLPCRKFAQSQQLCNCVLCVECGLKIIQKSHTQVINSLNEFNSQQKLRKKDQYRIRKMFKNLF